MMSWFKKEPYLSYSLNSSWIISSKRSACSLAKVSLERDWEIQRKAAELLVLLVKAAFSIFPVDEVDKAGGFWGKDFFLVVVGVSSETSLLQSHFGGDKRKLLKIFFVKLRLANILKLLDRKVFVLGISTDSTFGSIFPSPVTSKRLKTVPMNLVGKN